MTKEQSVFQRSVLTPAKNVSVGNAFDQLGNAAGNLSTIISRTASDAAIIKAGEQGSLDRDWETLTFFAGVKTLL